MNFLQQHFLPPEGIFDGAPERINVFKNLEGVIAQVEPKEKYHPYTYQNLLLDITFQIADRNHPNPATELVN